MPNINPYVEQNELHDYEIDGHKISVGWGKAVKINPVPFYTGSSSSSTAVSSDIKPIAQKENLISGEIASAFPKEHHFLETGLDSQSSEAPIPSINEAVGASRANVVINNWDAKPSSQV